MIQIREPGSLAEDFDWWDLEYRNLDELLTCSICRTAFVEPYCTDCGHTFCHKCLISSCKATHSDKSPAICPIDRRPIDTCPHPAPFVVKHLLDELIVKCPFSERGCTYEGKRWVLESHISLECNYAKVYCCNSCDNEIERRYYLDVNYRCKCNYTQDDKNNETTKADNELTKKVNYSTDVSTNNAINEAGPQSLKCAGASFGCNFECNDSKINEYDLHNSQCPWAKVSCSIKKQNSQMINLENENRALRRQLDTFQKISKKESVLLDSEILKEYDRIIEEVRLTQSCQAEQQTLIAKLSAENAMLSGDLSHLKMVVDSLRRQLFHFSQSQKRISVFNAIQSSHCDTSDTSTSRRNYEDNVKIHSKQKL